MKTALKAPQFTPCCSARVLKGWPYAFTWPDGTWCTYCHARLDQPRKAG